MFVGVHWTVVGLSVLGKIGASTAFATIYLFSAELFPTVVRNSAMGVSSLSARIGGMISPYIAIIVSHLTLGLIEMNHVVCVYRREINCQLLHACYHIFFVKFYNNLKKISTEMTQKLFQYIAPAFGNFMFKLIFLIYILILNFLQNEVVGGDLGVAMPLVVFGLFAFVAGLLALTLPETKGRHLPESIKDSIKYTE